MGALLSGSPTGQDWSLQEVGGVLHETGLSASWIGVVLTTTNINSVQVISVKVVELASWLAERLFVQNPRGIL